MRHNLSPDSAPWANEVEGVLRMLETPRVRPTPSVGWVQLPWWWGAFRFETWTGSQSKTFSVTAPLWATGAHLIVLQAPSLDDGVFTLWAGSEAVEMVEVATSSTVFEETRGLIPLHGSPKIDFFLRGSFDEQWIPFTLEIMLQWSV